VNKKIESNFMVITLNVRYDDSLILPYKEGVAVIAALENAKVLHQGYGEESKIIDVKNSDIKTSSIGAQEYGEALLRATLLAEGESM